MAVNLAVLTSFRGYTPQRIPADLVAGITVWAVLVPEALAYATIAGVSPVVGLYAAPAALVLYAVFGSSRHLVVGPMAATAALSAAAIAEVADDRDALALTAGLAIVVGLLGIVAGLARLGFLASFISEPVLKGFIIGLALTIIVGQFPKLFGVPGGDGDFFDKAWDLIAHLGETQWRTLAVGVASLVVVVLLRRFVPRAPAPLIAVILGIVAVSVFDLADKGVAIVGQIDPGLPHVGLPDLGWSGYTGLAGSAVGVLLVGFAEGLGRGRRTGGHRGTQAALAGVLRRARPDLRPRRRADLIAALAALFGVLVFDTLPGLFIGIAVSVVLIVYRASRPHVAELGRAADGPHWVDVDRHPDATTASGVLVVRPESGLFYANADNVKADIAARVDDSTRAVVLDLADAPVIDVTAIAMLTDLADDLDRRGLHLTIARDIGQVRGVLIAARADLLVNRAYPTVDAAVHAVGAPSPPSDDPET